MIRVALVDEHELVRIGLKTVLKQDEGIEVVADTGNRKGLLALVARRRPDILFIDVTARRDQDTAGCSEPELLSALHSRFPELKAVLMSTVFDLDCLLHTLCGTAAGYLLKSTGPEELIAAVHALACGGIYINSRLIESLPKRLLRIQAAHAAAAGAAGAATGVGMAAAAGPTPPLSAREQAVLDLLVKGHTNREVSERLYLSPKTVEAYRARIYTKLGVRSRADMFSCALEKGLVAL
jgi:two-component system response regulator NreC